MTKANRWLLPDGVDEILPPRASQLETLRREILDLYSTWGYQLIKTSLIEFLDSLNIVPSGDLHLSTFKIVDQLTGKTMGVRADITSQASRIDAHVLQNDHPTRLCYADSVLRTLPESHLGSRSPQLIGAELYGHTGCDSDIEVISLMLETLRIAGIENVQLAVGHSNIYRALLEEMDLEPELSKRLFVAMQNKAITDITAILESANIDSGQKELLARLPWLHGDESVLDEAEQLFPGSSVQIERAIRRLRDIAEEIHKRFPEQSLYFDLCELRGFEYHTGVVFAAYVEGHGQAIANGGRYDHIGEAFGRLRAATGFDADLKTLLALSTREFPTPDVIFAPAGIDSDLLAKISELRNDGQIVVHGLTKQTADAKDMGCTRQLVKQDGHWLIEEI